MKRSVAIVLILAFLLTLAPMESFAASGKVIIDAKVGLVLRSQPSTSSVKLLTIPYNTTVTYTAENGQWLQVSYGGKTGWIFKTYTRPASTTTSTPTPTTSPTTGSLGKIKITSKDGLNVRATASTSGKLLTTIPYGATVDYYSYANRWYKVTYNGKTGYVYDYYTQRVSSSSTPSPSPTTGIIGKIKITSPDGLNVRATASTSGRLLTTIPYGTTVDYYLAIHSNATGTTSAYYGALGIYNPKYEESVKVSKDLVSSLAQEQTYSKTGMTSGQGVMDGTKAFDGVGYAEIREPGKKDIPSTILEVDFHDNATTGSYIKNNHDKIAKAIARSLIRTFQLTIQ